MPRTSDVDAFIEAADRLINLLAGPSRPSDEQAKTDAYNRYDAARAALHGDPSEEE